MPPFSSDPNMTGNAGSSMDELARLFSGQAQQSAQKASDLYGEAYSTPKVDMNDALKAGIIGLAPLIIGALMKGKKGLYAGAMGGALGTQAFGQELKEDIVRKQAESTAQAKIEAANMKSFQDKALQTQVDKAKEGYRQEGEIKELFAKKMLGLGGGANVTIKMPPEFKGLPESQVTKIEEATDIYADSIGVTDNIKTAMNDALSQTGENFSRETILDENGDYDFKKAWNLFSRGLTAEIKGGEDRRGNIMNMVKAWADKYNKVITGAAQTDTEFKRRYGTILQKGALQITPATIPTILDMIDYLGGSYRAKAESRFRAASILAGDNVSPAQRMTNFNNYLNDIASGKMNGPAYGGAEQGETNYTKEVLAALGLLKK